MKLSLQRRIQLSFFLSIALVAAIGVISFYYIQILNRQVQQIVSTDLALSHSAEKIAAGLFSLRRVERTYLVDPKTPLFHESLQVGIDDFREAVREGAALCVRDDTREKHENILQLINEYESIIRETEIPFDPRNLSQKLDALTRQIREMVMEISELRYADLEAHRRDAVIISEQSNRNIILMVVTTVLAGLVLGIFAPSKVILPFRKLLAAIQEVQAANFNVSVNIEGEDEIAELGVEFNKMIEEIRTFDDMKIKKIAFEKRKLDSLANMVDAGVIVITVEGVIVYMNRRLYEILGLTSERILNVGIDEAPLPSELKELFLESIERKDRFEDRRWSFTYETPDKKAVTQEVSVSLSPVRNHVGDIVNFVVALKETKAASKAAKLTDLGDTW